MVNSSFVHECISRTVHLQKFMNLTQELVSTAHELERLEKFMIHELIFAWGLLDYCFSLILGSIQTLCIFFAG